MIINTFFVAAFKVAHSISWLRPFAHFSSHIGQPHSGHLWTWLCFYVLNWIYWDWIGLRYFQIEIYSNWAIYSNWNIFKLGYIWKYKDTCSCHQQVSGTANNILMKSGNDFSFKPRVGWIRLEHLQADGRCAHPGSEGRGVVPHHQLQRLDVTGGHHESGFKGIALIRTRWCQPPNHTHKELNTNLPTPSLFSTMKGKQNCSGLCNLLCSGSSQKATSPHT